MRELEREPSTNPPPLAGPSRIPPLAVIGPGRVGRSIAAAAERAGVRVMLAGREGAVAACRRSQAALLCVPDDEIPAVCETVAAAVPPLGFVGHTSGATALDALDAARRAGAQAFSLHPLQTVPDGETDLTGAPCAVAGSDDAALELARRLGLALGMRPFEVPEERRAAYHAAAAMASNLLVALEESAARLLDAAGVDSPGRKLLSPLVLRTAANWAERGPAALTGPIARGDSATIQGHLEALWDLAPELVPAYEALADRARAVAVPAEARP